MKRLMPSSLITFLQENRTCQKADLFSIVLPTGETLYATEGQWDLTVPSGTPGWGGGTTTFKSTQYGVWSRGPITSEAGFKCSANTMSLSCVVQQTTQYPGLSVGLLGAALNHLFDGSTVRVYTAYMPVDGYGDVSAGIETKWAGTITRAPSYTRNKVEFECADYFYLLNMKVPSRLMQSNCPFGFADSNCGLDPGNFTVGFTADTGSNQGVLIPLVAFTQADGYFEQGVVTCVTGANAGLSQTVRSHAGGSVIPMVPWLLPVSPGDTFSIIKGCAKTVSACQGTKRTSGASEPQDYKLRFGGTPFTPVPSTSI